MRTAILNGFGLSLGDGIIGLQALSVARSRGVLEDVVLYRRQPEQDMVRQLYALARDLTALDALPARPPGRVIDMRDFAFDPSFRRVAMIDWFLARLGLEPDVVPSREKRNTWLAPRILAPRTDDPYVLVCPRAAIHLREMPGRVHKRILGWLRANTMLPIRTQGEWDGADPRIVPRARARTVAELCGQVANARCMIATDTAMVHLADAFGIPCLAFFTTHDPAWRVRDYPRCTAIWLRPRGLPEAIEFARCDADLAAAREAWFPRAADLGWLDDALAAWWDQRWASAR